MANNEQSLKYDENIGLYDRINPILNLKDLNRKQVKELAKEIANNKSQTHSWQEVSNDAVNYDSKNKRQEKRFKRIFNKQLNENLTPILEKQHKQELIDRMKSGDASAMSQWTTEGIDKFGHQFMPVMLTAATLPFGIGAFGKAANTIGLLPSLGAEASSWGLGYGSYKLGSKLDDGFGTNWIAPALSAASGIGGYGAGYKGMVKLGSRGWLPKGDKFMYGSQFVGDAVADGLNRGIRTTSKVPAIDRTVGIQNRVFTGDPIFPKTTWQIPAFNTNSAYRLTGQSQIDDMLHTGFVRPRSGKIKGGHTNEVHWSAGNAKSGYNIKPGQYILESPRGLVDGTSNAIGVNDLSHVWTTRNGQVVDVIDEIRPHMRTIDSPLSSKGAYTWFERPSKLTIAERRGTPKGKRNQPLNGHLKGDDAVQMFKEYGTQFPEDMVRLYRASGTSGNFNPSLDGTAKYSGMWFTDNPRKVNRYASSTFKTAKRNGVDNPIVLEYIDIPKSQLDQFRAKNIIKGNDVEFEPTEDFLIPVDHTGRKQVSWAGFTGNYLSDMRIPHPELPPISKNSKIYSQIQQLVPEARERYKLVGRTDITDDEIAGSLYKRAMELNGEGNAAVWTETGEPRLLFRGDTRRYNRLMDKWSPEKLAKGEGTMDNSLGNLFLGAVSGKGQGVDRYFISGTDFWEPIMQGSSTGARGKFGTIFANGGEGIQGTNIPYIPKDAYKLSTYQAHHGPYSLYKFPGKYSESGISDLNTFITRTPAMRDATGEISVLADDVVMKTKNYRGPNIDDYDGPTYDGVNSTVRDAMAKHYQSVLDDAQSKEQGLLFSEGLTNEYVKKFGEIHPFRREHEWYDYYALPNFNRQNAKHLFGWDLRHPVQWNVDNIYLEKGGKIENPAN